MKIWGDTDRKEERQVLDTYTKQAEIMVRYLRQFTPKWNRALNVFLCHSSGDKEFVRTLYNQLAGEGWIDPWLDEEKLLPGEDWDLEIGKAVRIADVVIVVLSQESVTKEGYVQKEVKQALDIAEEKPEGTIFIIPLKVEPCDVPSRLSAWQWIDYYKSDSYDSLLKSLLKRAQTLKIRSE